ncbi:MalY/PatB family protein [Mycobacterium sp. NPDC003449]
MTPITTAFDWNLERSRSRGTKRWSVYGPDVIDLTVAEMDLPTAGPIVDAVRAAVDRETFGYPIPPRGSGLLEIAAGWLGRQHGLTVDPAGIAILPELMRGITNALNLYTPAGSPVVVPTPTYRSFFGAIQNAGRAIVETPMLCGDDGYRLDLDGIDAALAAGARAVLLCHPANPVGRVFGVDELTALADIVERHDAVVISDEIHAPLRYDVDFVPYASIDDRARDHSVTLFSATKAWNIAGLRTGFIALTNRRHREAWAALPGAATGGISPLGMVATAAAFEHGEPWLRQALEFLDGMRRSLHDVFGDGGLAHIYTPPEGTYLAWLDLRCTGLVNPAALLLDEYQVATTPGPDHGLAGKGFVRLNFATEPDVLLESARRINDFVMKHSSDSAR